MAFVRFAKRTGGLKLEWLERKLAERGIPNRRNGESWHAPILEVEEARLDEAWEILTPYDDEDDDDPMFAEGAEAE